MDSATTIRLHKMNRGSPMNMSISVSHSVKTGEMAVSLATFTGPSPSSEVICSVWLGCVEPPPVLQAQFDFKSEFGWLTCLHELSTET